MNSTMANKNEWLSALSEDLIVDLTTKLVAIPSRNPPGEEKECAEFILSTLRGWGIDAEPVYDPDPARPQVAAWVEGAGTDMRNLVFDQDIPAVNFGAGDFNVCHKPNEFVPIGDLVRCGHVLLGTILDLLAQPS